MSLGWVKDPREACLVRMAMIGLPLVACVPLALIWRMASEWTPSRFWLTLLAAFVGLASALLIGMRLNARRPGFDAGRIGSVIGGVLWFIGALGLFSCFAAAVWRSIDAIAP